jgi:phosphopantothenate synthetase
MRRNITLAIDDSVVREVRKLAIERDTTLTQLVREYLEKLVADTAQTEEKQRAIERLEDSFRRFEFRVGKRTWTRADLHERS